MPELLTDIEARILGSLVEKSRTTPELYPLSLNALVNACNQKSSREPVMELDHGTVERVAENLCARGFAARRHEPGGRTVKYGHRLEVMLGTESDKIIGLICILFLRGPQTLGELKSRTERLCVFESLAEVEALLNELGSRLDGPIVSKAARQHGQKEARYRHLFTAESADTKPVTAVSAPSPGKADASGVDSDFETRLTLLEARVRKLENPSGQ